MFVSRQFNHITRDFLLQEKLYGETNHKKAMKTFKIQHSKVKNQIPIVSIVSR